MDDVKFEKLSKAAYTATSRRQAIKYAGLAAAGGAMSLVAPGRAQAATGRCKKGGFRGRGTRGGGGGFCAPPTGRCTCRPGSNACAATGACVTCGPSQVFNASTCQCEC